MLDNEEDMEPNFCDVQDEQDRADDLAQVLQDTQEVTGVITVPAFDDIRTDNVMRKIQTRQPDCLIAIGVPPKINRFIIENHHNFSLSRGGFIVLISDFELRRNLGEFHEYNGNCGINSHIFVYGR